MREPVTTGAPAPAGLALAGLALAWPALAAGTAVSLVSVTQNPRHESQQAVTSGRYSRQRGSPDQGPAAFLAGLILPHRTVTGGPMGEI
jgi:hypothetical protein